MIPVVTLIVVREKAVVNTHNSIMKSLNYKQELVL